MIRKIIINIFALVFLITNTSFADIKFWTTEVQPARMAKQEAVSYTHLTLPTITGV